MRVDFLQVVRAVGADRPVLKRPRCGPQSTRCGKATVGQPRVVVMECCESHELFEGRIDIDGFALNLEDLDGCEMAVDFFLGQGQEVLTPHDVAEVFGSDC